MVALDTDVLLLAFAFHRDERHEVNQRFLEQASGAAPVVAIYSVMELLGQLSFNLPAERLSQWPVWLQDRYRLTIAYPPSTGLDGEAFFHRELVEFPLEHMRHRGTPFLDALILGLIERVTGVSALVTWNARHFRGRTDIPVFTPAEFLSQ